MPRNRGLGRARHSPGTVKHPFNPRTFATKNWSRVIPQPEKMVGRDSFPLRASSCPDLLDGGVSLLGRRDLLAQLGDRRVHLDAFSLAHSAPASGRSSAAGSGARTRRIRPQKATKWPKEAGRPGAVSPHVVCQRLSFVACAELSRRDKAKCPTPTSSSSLTPRLFP